MAALLFVTAVRCRNDQICHLVRPCIVLTEAGLASGRERTQPAVESLVAGLVQLSVVVEPGSLGEGLVALSESALVRLVSGVHAAVSFERRRLPGTAFTK